MHRLSRKITEREPFHLDDLGASNRGGKLGRVVLRSKLIELVGKSCAILVCVRFLSVGAGVLRGFADSGCACSLMNEGEDASASHLRGK